MYTNEERRNISVKNIVLVFLFIALFIFLLLWLLPSKSSYKKLQTKVDELAMSSEATGQLDLSVIYDRIFNENVIAMKEAAQSYFTLERLPQEVGGKVKITLQQMLDAHLLLEFKDKNGNKCDTKESYVEVTKYNNEYVMKVNLKCGEEENYILVHMGCYDYCSKTICEVEGKVVTAKNVKVYKTVTPITSSPSCTLAVTSGTRNGDYYTSDVTIGFSSKYAGANAAMSGFGLSTTTNYNGRTNYIVSGIGSHTVYGYVKNSFGNTSKCSITVAIKNTDTPTPETYYEYTKTTVVKGTCVYGDWSAWSTTEIKPTSTLEVKRGTFQQKYLIGYNVTTENDLTKPIIETKTIPVATTTHKSCTAYTYTGTISYDSNWTYVGLVKTTSTPVSTDTVKYFYKGTYDWYCTSSDNCSAGTVYVYEKYIKNVKSSSTGSYTCSNWVTDTVVTTATKSVITGYEQKTVKTPVYEYKTYYKWASRTKSCTADVTTTKKVCSTKNNAALINDGYVATGNTCTTKNA